MHRSGEERAWLWRKMMKCGRRDKKILPSLETAAPSPGSAPLLVFPSDEHGQPLVVTAELFTI